MNETCSKSEGDEGSGKFIITPPVVLYFFVVFCGYEVMLSNLIGNL